MDSKRVLLFGGSGMLGKRVAAAMSGNGWSVTTPFRGQCPIDNYFSIDGVVGASRPDLIINCAGSIPLRFPSTGEMIAVNAVGPHHIARVAQERGGIPVIHISTDCVFSGTPNLRQPAFRHRITDTPYPKDVYGKSKLLGEVNAPHVTNVRTSFVGPEHGLWPWLTSHKGGTVDGWGRAMWSGSTVDAVADAIATLAERPPGGIVHLATAEQVSKYEVLMALKEHLVLEVKIVPVMHPIIDRGLEPTVILPSLVDALKLRMAVAV